MFSVQVFPWSDRDLVPHFVGYQIPNFGGDEDYVIVAPLSLDDEANQIAEKLAICSWNRDEREFPGVGTLVIYTTCHA